MEGGGSKEMTKAPVDRQQQRSKYLDDASVFRDCVTEHRGWYPEQFNACNCGCKTRKVHEA